MYITGSDLICENLKALKHLHTSKPKRGIWKLSNSQVASYEK